MASHPRAAVHLFLHHVEALVRLMTVSFHARQKPVLLF